MPVGTSSTRIDPMSSSNGNGGEPRPGSVTPTKPTSKQMKKSLLTDQDAGGFDDHEMSPMPMRSDEVAEENGGGGGHGGSTEDMQVDIDESLLMTDEHGLSDNEAEQRLLKFGRNELPDVRVPKWKIFLSHFTGIMPGMIIAAICIEGILTEWPDFAVLSGLLFLNGFIGFWEDMRAGDAVAALKASLKPEAQVKRNGEWRKMDAGLLVPGDRIALNAGANVPADSRVCKGMEIQVDQAALTGESLPVQMGEGDSVKMGSTVVSGENEAIVASTGINTFFGKTAALIGSTHDVGNFQKVIIRITKTLLYISTILVIIAVTYLAIREWPAWLPAVSFGVVLLVASIPIAMQVVCTATMALGSRLLAAQKAIVARLSSIEQLAGMTVLCSDKTGTLTLNKMVLQEMVSYAEPELDGVGVLTLAALATKWKEPPKDALDTLVLKASMLDRAFLDTHEQLDFKPFDPTRKRTEATLKSANGVVFDVIKGAPHVVLGLCDADNRAAIGAEFDAKVEDLANRGIRALAVARTLHESNKTIMVGLLTFLDPPRPDTKMTIQRAMMQGVVVKMITGDHRAIARETARSLGMGDSIGTTDGLPNIAPGETPPTTLGRDYGDMIEKSDGFAQVFPEHKFLIVEALRQRGWSVGMTGDGVNDAPALKKADVGIAVEGATDAARAAADLVLTAPGLSVIVDAIVISRCIFQRMKNYVIYRVACTIQLLLFFFFAVFSFHPRYYNDEHVKLKHLGEPNAGPNGGYVYKVPIGEHLPNNFPYNYSESCVYDEEDNEMECTYGFRMLEKEWGLEIPKSFNLPVIALVVIVILNDATIISIAYDHVKPSTLPERWNLPVLFVVAIWIGMVACGSSLLLLDWALQSEDPNSPLRSLPGFIGLEKGLTYGQVVAMMYLKISLSDWWTIFAARTQGPFYSRAPSRIVFAAASFATIVSTFNSMVWVFQLGEKNFEVSKLMATKVGSDGGLDISACEPCDFGTDCPKGQCDQDEDAQIIGLTFEMVLFTWIYTILWFLVQDGCKVIMYKILYYFDVCGIRTEAEANKERIERNKALQSTLATMAEEASTAASNLGERV